MHFLGETLRFGCLELRTIVSKFMIPWSWKSRRITIGNARSYLKRLGVTNVSQLLIHTWLIVVSYSLKRYHWNAWSFRLLSFYFRSRYITLRWNHVVPNWTRLILTLHHFEIVFCNARFLWFLLHLKYRKISFRFSTIFIHVNPFFFLFSTIVSRFIKQICVCSTALVLSIFVLFWNRLAPEIPLKVWLKSYYLINLLIILNHTSRRKIQ